MFLPGRLPPTLLYTWATVLTLAQVAVWHSPFPPTPTPAPPLEPAPCQPCLRRLLRHPPAWDNKHLQHHLETILESPSSSSSSSSSSFPSPNNTPWASVISYNITEGNIRTILGGQRNGVFVEVGAQDGLWLSNTWWLEAERGWRGLLVEADPHNYLQLRASPRTSMILPACVTSSLLTAKEKMVRYNSTTNDSEPTLRHQQGHSKLRKYATGTELYVGETFTVTCYSIFSVLRAAGLRKMDLMTFDISGGGYEMTIDFLELNKKLGSPFQARMILYQDNELPQFFSMDGLKEEFRSYGYTLIQLSMNHYLLHDQSIKLVVKG